MYEQKKLEEMSLLELNNELKKAIDELGRELKALGILKEDDK